MKTVSSLHDDRRLSALRDLAILDTTPESAYDDLAVLAASVCSSPMAAVNLVDDERHFTKAIVGMPEAEGGSVSNSLSLCAATVDSPEGVLIIRDSHTDPRWSEHPLVIGGPRVGFYAGVSITSQGQRVGVLCAFGSEPRDVTGAERTALLALARQAESELELRRRNAELRSLAVTDPLTRLGNRTLLWDRLELALAERARSGGEVGVVFCDVNDFKGVNDRHGHQIGDRALCEIADHLRANVRAVDTVARIAGDEFVIVCPHITAVALSHIVERITHANDRLLPDGSRAPQLSVGTVIASADETAASALRRADGAMYAAKAEARKRNGHDSHVASTRDRSAR